MSGMSDAEIYLRAYLKHYHGLRDDADLRLWLRGLHLRPARKLGRGAYNVNEDCRSLWEKGLEERLA